VGPPTRKPPFYEGDEPEPLAPWLRGGLVAIAVAFAAVFGVAAWLNPYGEDGSARSMATHQQLGLPPCSFVETTGVPCPSCGMTTSFALLVRGDLRNSLRANWVGTLLAVSCLAYIPWAVFSVVRGRTLFFRSLEKVLVGFIVGLLTLMLLRWGLVVGLGLW
jgi:hypothetical protein